jgi:carbonic anhydrase/acetyltransferase-like protein (isoleucine patch superfamily)
MAVRRSIYEGAIRPPKEAADTRLKITDHAPTLVGAITDHCICEENILLIEHRGGKPQIDASATIAPGAIISGDVQIGAHSVVLAGAVVTAQGAPVRIGQRSIIMEQAVIRGAGKHPCHIADHVLVGPHSHISGAVISRRCFIATGAAIFNGAVLEEGTVVAINGIVHIATRCPPATFVPMAHIAFGDPAQIYPPAEAPSVHKAIASLGFTRTVFGFDSATLADSSAIEELCDRYSRALARHRDDRLIQG